MADVGARRKEPSSFRRTFAPRTLSCHMAEPRLNSCQHKFLILS